MPKILGDSFRLGFGLSFSDSLEVKNLIYSFTALMFNVVLVEPEIPPNTGNVIRLCANSGSQLHLIQPLGFALDNAKLRRAGLDYHEFAPLRVYDSFDHFYHVHRALQERFFALSTKATTSVFSTRFLAGDFFIFGKETAGLSETVKNLCAQELHIPMRAGNRSLNLGNSAAITVYEAWRQNGFV